MREAQCATQVDAGGVTVDTKSLSVYAGQPILVGPDKYFRIFSAEWEAQAGNIALLISDYHITYPVMLLFQSNYNL